MSSAVMMPLLPGLLAPEIEILDEELGELRTLLAWKRVRETSAGLYAFLKDTKDKDGKDLLARMRKLVLNEVAATYNATQVWPTSGEVHDRLARRGFIPNDKNYNRTRPRFTELSKGWTESHVVEVNGVRTKVKRFVPCSVLIAGPRRKDTQSGISCITWHVREFSETPE